MIQESIVTTLNVDGSAHLAPMGIQTSNHHLYLAPFNPSTTLDNLLREKTATINYTTDVRIFAGALTGRHDWPLYPTKKISGYRLASALTHIEVKVTSIEEDEIRPRFCCKAVYEDTHAPFLGFNRAQAAVIELAILISRLNMLPPEKIDSEIKYLQIAIEKTAGANERVAWLWLMKKLELHREEQLQTP